MLFPQVEGSNHICEDEEGFWEQLQSFPYPGGALIPAVASSDGESVYASTIAMGLISNCASESRSIVTRGALSAPIPRT